MKFNRKTLAITLTALGLFVGCLALADGPPKVCVVTAAIVKDTNGVELGRYTGTDAGGLSFLLEVTGQPPLPLIVYPSGITGALPPGGLLYFTSSDCSGTAYIATFFAPSQIKVYTWVNLASGDVYKASGADSTGISILSHLGPSGTCNNVSQTITGRTATVAASISSFVAPFSIE